MTSCILNINPLGTFTPCFLRILARAFLHLSLCLLGSEGLSKTVIRQRLWWPGVSRSSWTVSRYVDTVSSLWVTFRIFKTSWWYKECASHLTLPELGELFTSDSRFTPLVDMGFSDESWTPEQDELTTFMLATLLNGWHWGSMPVLNGTLSLTIGLLYEE